MNRRTRSFIAITVLSALILTVGCSVEKFALRKTADILAGSSAGSVFSGDDDPELVGEALPFAIKFYESLLASLPDHSGLRLQTGRLYIVYANGFVEAKADVMSRSELESREALLERSKKLYLRGRNILLPGLLKKNPALLEQLKARKYAEGLAVFGKKEIDFLYWAAAGWVAAYAIDPFDTELGLSLPEAAALMNRVLEIDPDYGHGAVHNFFILYYGSLPSSMGGDLLKARDHFRAARRLCAGSDTSYLISLAATVCVKEQNRAEFESLLGEVLAFEVDKSPENRLVNTLNKRKAAWLLVNIDDYFLPPGKSPKTGEEIKS